MDDLVAWLQGLFRDCRCRAPFGVGWQLDRAEPPLSATVTPADRAPGQIAMSRDDVLERINFAARLQAFLDIELGTPIPPCPTHRVGLTATRLGDAAGWRCPEGDFECRIGDYEDALWPPSPDEARGRIAPMLAHRFHRRHLTGIKSFGAELRDGGWVCVIKLRPDADESAIRAAADPVALEVDWVDAVRTARLERAATDREPAHRALTIVGAPMPLAALRGLLRRAGTDDPWDFYVNDTPVRLLPDHQRGAPGSPVVSDVTGVAFADEEDSVCCVGGFGHGGPVKGEPQVFSASELRVYE